MRKTIALLLASFLGLAALLHRALPGAVGGQDGKGARPGAGAPAPAPVKEWVNPKDGSTLIWIPGGEFVMGSDGGDPDEVPPHEVAVEGFWIGKSEVTNAQYAAFLEATDEREPMHWNAEGFRDTRQPVVGVTWQEAKAYADWAELRLPTEAEWECAARAGRGYRYPTATGEIGHDLANYQGKAGKDAWDGPAPSGSFPATPLGLYDMAGNAWEWTSSIYEPYPYSSEDGREDDGRTRAMRVMRGGAWFFTARYLTSTFRRRFSSHLEYDYAGFRVALSHLPGEPGRAEQKARKTLWD